MCLPSAPVYLPSRHYYSISARARRGRAGGACIFPSGGEGYWKEVCGRRLSSVTPWHLYKLRERDGAFHILHLIAMMPLEKKEQYISFCFGAIHVTYAAYGGRAPLLPLLLLYARVAACP